MSLLRAISIALWSDPDSEAIDLLSRANGFAHRGTGNDLDDAKRLLLAAADRLPDLHAERVRKELDR